METQPGNGIVACTVYCQIKVTRGTQRNQVFRPNELIGIAAGGQTKLTILKNQSRCTIKAYKWPSVARKIAIQFSPADVKTEIVVVVSPAYGQPVRNLIRIVDASLRKVINVHSDGTKTSYEHLAQRAYFLFDGDRLSYIRDWQCVRQARRKRCRNVEKF